MTLVLTWAVVDILLLVAWACRPQEYAWAGESTAQITNS